ncbi:DHH family phosphoesterase [Aerophototrophica crusticola]|uniref:DHH family phosphoesterase n=1 Tax=Aerophototrophica crusticola TaxID=1709002 RepID=A0A858RAN5_9PROT|nr:DHH family phosphoesterase [Rhodospirillaceae bacterium B3]
MDFSPQTEPDQHAAFAQALAGFTRGRPVTVLCHFDADGLSAGALFARGLARAGHEPALRLVGRGEDPWSAEMGRELADAAPGGIVATDLGVRRDPLAPGVPTVLVDHHVPQGLPDGQTTVVTGYGQDPTPCSALLAYRCLAGVTDMDPDLWLAALGTIGDLGERAPFAELAEAKRRHGAKLLREATSLINAPRRSASGDATPALHLLMKAKGPGEVVSGEHRRQPSSRPQGVR